MIEITDRMRVLLKEAFEKRGGVIKNMGFLEKKDRQFIYGSMERLVQSMSMFLFQSCVLLNHL